MKRAAPAVLWALALFALSSIPGEDLTMQPDVPHFDKFAHLGLYLVFGFLVARAVGGRGWRWGALLTLAIGAAYGASDEWHQSFVSGRSCSFWDWVTDCVGTTAGYGLWALAGVLRIGGRPQRQPEPEV